MFYFMDFIIVLYFSLKRLWLFWLGIIVDTLYLLLLFWTYLFSLLHFLTCYYLCREKPIIFPLLMSSFQSLSLSSIWLSSSVAISYALHYCSCPICLRLKISHLTVLMRISRIMWKSSGENEHSRPEWGFF